MVTGLTWYSFDDSGARRAIIARLKAEGESQHYQNGFLTCCRDAKISGVVIQGSVDMVVLTSLSKDYPASLFVVQSENTFTGLLNGATVEVDPISV